MKLTNQNIINHINALLSLGGVELPVQITYALKKNHRKLVTEYKDYEEQLDELKIKYPEKEEPIMLNNAVKELLAIENEIEIHKVPEELFITGDFKISAQQLESLEFMIETR